MATTERHQRPAYPADKPPVLHVSQVVAVALTLHKDLKVLVRSADNVRSQADHEWVLPRRWVGRPMENDQLTDRALEGSSVSLRDAPIGTATARFDQAASVRPAGGLLSVVTTALVPEEPLAAPGWQWIPVSGATAVLSAWDQEALGAARTKARDMLRDTDTALRLLPPTFAIGDLRRLYEAHWDVELNPSNFARQALKGPGGGWLEDVEQARGGLGRPATLYSRSKRGAAPSLAPR